MDEEMMKKLVALDDAAAEAGGYVSQMSCDDISYDYRGIIEYCEKKGIEPLDMTIREFNKFAIL